MVLVQARIPPANTAQQHCDPENRLTCPKSACGNCQKKDALRKSCTYHTPKSCKTSYPSQPTPSSYPSASSEGPDESEACGVYYVGVNGLYSDVKALINARAGLPSGGWPILIPMTDAPLFGLRPRRHPADSRICQVDNVLPPRKHADQLMEIYWQNIQPFEPFLEPERFSNSYKALFEGSLLNDDERIFVSTLNTLFALSTQLQECMPSEQREEVSNTYFHRAWTLLQPETILWEPASLELLQCLLLMSRYLQCTNSRDQTWMALGCAVRMAQNLGLHLPERSSSYPLSSESRMKQQLWQCCVFMDRGISWMLGRTSMISLAESSTMFDLLLNSGQDEEYDVLSADYFTRTLELYEIAHHLMLSQVSPGNSLADRLGLPRLYKSEEYVANTLKLDNCLSKWEKNLPNSLRYDMRKTYTSSPLYKQNVILHLRFLHCKISLSKPMLARSCLPQSQIATCSTLNQGLGDRVLQDCVNLCIDNARKMIDVLHENHQLDGAVGIIPWWYRIFYLHVAGTIILTSMLRADLYTPTVSQSWNKLLSMLQVHEHLSPFVRNCRTWYRTLSCKILETNPSGGRKGEGSSNSYFQDVFQDMGFDPDNFLFGKEDMSWLWNLEVPP